MWGYPYNALVKRYKLYLILWIAAPIIYGVFILRSHNTNSTRQSTDQSVATTMMQKNIAKLTDLQRKVTQEDGTEAPFANEYWDNHQDGIYVDIVSGEVLFSSKDKFDSGTGWPSFTKPLDPANVQTKSDDSLLMSRTEVRSTKANSHLGHLFDDGPADKGGQRYCMNSAAMRFIPVADLEKEGYGQYLKEFGK